VNVVWPSPLLLAHGALGPFDEILLIVVAGLFVVMFAAPTVIAFVRRGRNASAGEDTHAAGPDATVDEQPEDLDTPDVVRRDHFRLD
jgi:hypothetical protein